jgi:hypothetical protein
VMIYHSIRPEDMSMNSDSTIHSSISVKYFMG